MGGFREWLKGMLPSSAVAPVPEDTLKETLDELDKDLKELSKQQEGCAIKVKDLPPDVRADIDEETEEAIRDGRLIVGPATVTTTPLRKRTPAMTQALVDKINADLLRPPPDTDEGYPVGDPKGIRPPDWDAGPQSSTPPLTEELLEAAKKLMAMANEAHADEEKAREIVNDHLEEDPDYYEGGGPSNTAFLTLMGAVQDVLNNAGMPKDNFSSPPEEADMTPHNDPLPQFLRPEVALRNLPDEARDYRAPIPFIRKVMELLRDVFPDVRDKLWVLNEIKDFQSNNIIVNVLVRVTEKPERDILIQISPSHSRCLVRAEEDAPVLDDTTLYNARWDDFVGWVSLAKSLAEAA